MDEQKRQQELLEQQKKGKNDLDIEVKKKGDDSTDQGDGGQSAKYKPKKRK